MTEDKRWLLTPITTKTTRAELDQIVSIMPPEYRGDFQPGMYATPARKAELRDWIKERRAAYWNLPRARQKEPDRALRKAGKFVGLTASECNEWMRTLPPVPPYPEVCECPLCRAARGANHPA